LGRSEFLRKAKIVKYLGVEQSRGRCPWRLRYEVDRVPLHAFFRPPVQGSSAKAEFGAFLVGLAILCDLAAEFRPERAVVEGGEAPASYPSVFRDAVGALMAEQDAYWRRQSARLPVLEVSTSSASRASGSLNPRRVVLGFSGGKDSLLSLFALLEAGWDVCPVLLNEGDRSWQDLRKWIPKLSRLGLHPRIAYLTTGRRAKLRSIYGDRYYSSYQLGWLTAILCGSAVDVGAGVAALGIESSPDRGWIAISEKRVNHQHQKTTSHIAKLQRLWQQALHPDLQIGSPISALTDREVLRALLSRVPPSLQRFSSCGAASSRSKHCGKCDKCAFVYLILMESAEGRRLGKRLFKRDLLDDADLYRPWTDARYRPPLACIGPREEVWSVFEGLLERGARTRVVTAWSESSLRRRFLARRITSGCSRPSERKAPLVDPVKSAARIAERWAS
jgi:hypothetical protein